MGQQSMLKVKYSPELPVTLWLLGHQSKWIGRRKEEGGIKRVAGSLDVLGQGTGQTALCQFHFFHVTDIGLLYPVPVQVLVTFSLDD